MRYFGIVNYTPDQIYNFLRKKEIKARIVTVDTPLKKEEKHKVFLLSSPDAYRANRKILDTKKAVSYLFCSPIFAYSRRIQTLDCDISEPLYEQGFVLREDIEQKIEKTLRLKNKETKFKKHRDILKDVLNSVQNIDSFLNPFMTFIYSTPSATHQKPIKDQICLWIYYNESSEKLNHRMGNLKKKGINLTEKQKKTMSNIVNSDTCSKYKEAIFSISKYSGDEQEHKIDEISKKMYISAYDIRYILSVVSKINIHGED